MIHIKKLLPGDLSYSINIASLHKDYITSGFLSTLNPSILIALYKEIIKSQILIAAFDKDRLIGFVSCTKNLNSLYKRFIFKNFFWIIPILSIHFFSFTFIKKLFESLLIPWLHKSESALEMENMPELLSIVVLKDYQKNGIAQNLLNFLVTYLKNERITCLRVVAGSEITSANRFYLKHHFKLYKQQKVHDNSISNFYYLELQNETKENL